MSDEERHPFPMHQSLTLGIGTFLTVGAVDLLAHLGPTGLVVGGIAAYVAARHGSEIVEQVRGVLPSTQDRGTPCRPPETSGGTVSKRPNSRSLLDRALGRFPDERRGAETNGGGETSGARDECHRPDVLSDFSRETQLLDQDWETELLPPPQAGEMFLFSSVLEQLYPSASRIFLARSLDGGDLTCSAQALCHVALAGSTGGGKCLEENEPVFLADGRIVSAKSLVGKTAQVVGVTGMQTMQQIPVTASFTDNGVRTVIEIELDTGVVIKRTEEHPLWAAKLDARQYVGLWHVPADGKRRRSPRTRAIHEGWVQAKDLRICGNRPNFDGHVLLCPTVLHQQGTISRPDADVILCAALLAEGCLTQDGTVGFTNADAPMVALVSQAANHYGCELAPLSAQRIPSCQYRICKKKLIPRPGYKFCTGCGAEKLLEEFHVHQHGFGGRDGRWKMCQTPKQKQFLKGNPRGGKGACNPIAQLVKDWGMRGDARTKVIPSWVFQLPDEQIATFLRVFIDCDGWFDKGEGQRNHHPAVNVSLANPVLVQQIGQLALRLGITGTYRYKANGHAGAWTWSSAMVDVWQERIGSTVKADVLARAVHEKQRRSAAAATDWDAWRQARPVDTQTFADCPEGYEWRKIVAIRRVVAPTVSIEVHNSNHAFVGYAVEHNSSIMRMLLLQLCKARMQVLLLNPHYTRYDIENDEDWTPFEPYLAHPPMECRKYEVVEHFLKVAAKDLIPKRLERRARSLPVGTPYFIAIDELPSIIREIKAAPEYMRVILEEGRKVGVFLISAAQDFLVKTISPTAGGGSIRECYRTAYYVGGDATTARVLLDTPANLIPEDELGKGVVMLRGGGSKKATKVLVPYVDNASLYKLLGPSTYRAETAQFTSSGIDFPFPDQRPLSQERPPAHRERVLETIELLADTLDEQTLIRLIHQLPRIREDEDEKGEESASLPPTLLERGIDAYQKGHTSLSKLAAALDISPWEARKLMPKVEGELKRREA